MNETWKEVANRVQRLGDNEFRLAYSRATNKNDANEIVALIEDYRQPYQEGKVANLGTAIFATAEQWERIATESNNAAKCELLKNSAELAELEKLEKAARAAQEAADAKSREVQAAWDEYNSLPDRIASLDTRIGEINDGMRELDTDALARQYKDIYKAGLKGAITDRFALVFAAESIITANLRKEVLNELAAELQSEMSEAKRRFKALERKLA